MHSAKVIISIVVLLAVIFAFSAYASNLLATTSQDLESHVAKIEEHIKAEDWEKIDTPLESVEKQWKKTSRTWAILIDHFEIDNIDAALSRMSMFIEAKDRGPALAEAGILRQYIRHIPEKESMRLINIF